MTNTEIDNAPEPSSLTRFLNTAGGALIGLFALGFMVGFLQAILPDGIHGLKSVAVLGLGIGLGLGLLALAWRMLKKGIGRPQIAKTPKMREYQIVLIALCLVGAIVGVLLQIDVHSSMGNGLGYNMPISRPLAIGLLAIQPLLAFLYWRWHRSADELEQAAYTFGALMSVYAYFFASTVWWIGWRGGLCSEPDGYAIFWLVMVVWTFGWLWRRYR